MYEFYLKIVDVLVAITDYYNGIHYLIYKVFFRGVEPLENFYLTEVNVGLWILTMFSIVFCFAMIFIPLKNASITQRPVRRKIKMAMPFGILLSPLPIIVMFFFELYVSIGWSYRMIQRIYVEIKAEQKYKASQK